VSKFIEIL